MLNVFAKVSFLVHNKKIYLIDDYMNLLIVNILQLINCKCKYIL